MASENPLRSARLPSPQQVTELLEGAFGRAGYDVVQAADGEEALALLDAAGPFDLLVTDYAMPGLSGLELIDAVRLRKPQMPILMVTGYADTGQEAADVPRLQKPFLPAELVDRVQALIAEA